MNAAHIISTLRTPIATGPIKITEAKNKLIMYVILNAELFSKNSIILFFLISSNLPYFIKT